MKWLPFPFHLREGRRAERNHTSALKRTIPEPGRTVWILVGPADTLVIEISEHRGERVSAVFAEEQISRI